MAILSQATEFILFWQTFVAIELSNEKALILS